MSSRLLLDKIYEGDAGEILKTLGSEFIDLVVTDPPYGLEFMGKDWDRAVPSVKIWKDAVRVLKPGAFAFILCTPRQDCLSHMIVNLESAGFDCGFTSIYWTYACLSSDTELLTREGWKAFNDYINGKNKEIVCYGRKNDSYFWQKPTQLYAYLVDECLYHIWSKQTDQLVSQNHRVFTARGLVYAESLQKQESIAYLPKLPHPILELPRVATEREESRTLLLNQLPTAGEYQKISLGEQKIHSPYVGIAESEATAIDVREKELGMERRRYLLQDTRQLRGNQIRSLSTHVSKYGKERRLRDGASINRSESSQSFIEANGSRSSCEPQPYGQSLRELVAIQNEQRTQDVRGRVSYSTTLARVTRIRYQGWIYCPTISSGCFVARRNGKIFLTGNSGFPKAENISLSIDKRECKRQLSKKLGRTPTKEEFKEAWSNFRQVVGKGHGGSLNFQNKVNLEQGFRPNDYYNDHNGEFDVTIPATVEAQAIKGSYAGFQPKPAVEVIIVAMKPLSERTYVDQALKNGKGVTWLDDCRLPFQTEKDKAQTEHAFSDLIGTLRHSGLYKQDGRKTNNATKGEFFSPKGRFPANLLVSDDTLNDGIARPTGALHPYTMKGKPIFEGGFSMSREYDKETDSGSFSRYFDLDKWWEKKVQELPGSVQKVFPFLIVPKASKSERNEGVKKTVKDVGHNRFDKCKRCGGYLLQNPDRPSACRCKEPIREHNIIRGNAHPTVKPLKLLSYLITLGSRKGDVVLDPFIGSGTTALAARILERHYVGIELNHEYVAIAEARLSGKPFLNLSSN